MQIVRAGTWLAGQVHGLLVRCLTEDPASDSSPGTRLAHNIFICPLMSGQSSYWDVQLLHGVLHYIQPL